MDRREFSGIILAAAAAVTWGFLGPVTREMSSVGFNTMQMTCLRFLIVSAVLGIFMFFRCRDQLRISRRMLLLVILMGTLGNGLNSVSYLSSMELISLSLATVLQYFSPFIVVVASFSLFGEELTRTKVCAVCLALLGCVLCTGVLTDNVTMDVFGIFLGVLSAFFFTFYTLGSKKAKTEGVPTLTILFYSSVACAVFLMPLCDIGAAISTVSASSYNLLLVLVLGLALTLLPFGMYNMSIELAEVGKVAVVTYVEPVTATVVGLLLYHEAVTLEIFFGIVLVLLALIMVNRKPKSSEVTGRTS